MKRAILHVVLIAGIVVLGYLVFHSVHKVTSFNSEEKFRIEKVAEKMKHIRTIQSAYKTKYDSYAPNWDTLMNFLKYDSLPVVLKTGNVPDSLSEQQALDEGLVTRDTSFLPAKDSLFHENRYTYELDELMLIPFSSHGNQKPDTFKMNAGMLKRSNIELPVFEVVAPKEAYLKGMNKELIARDDSKDLQVGSMKEASTDGNWE
ncbi:MAG: hypothetical protein ACQESZ_09895 [Bacteroidota bacterium]